MKKLPQSERVEFYKWLSAYTFFEQAHKILGGILALPASTPPWSRISMWTAFFVTYAKPFKQQAAGKKVKYSIRLDEKTFVPTEYEKAHKVLIEMRDKMYAHTDYSTHADEDGFQMNGVFASVNGKLELRFGIRSKTPPTETIQIMLQLVATLRDKAEAEYVKLWHLYSPACPLTTGCWDVNIEAHPNDLFLPLKATTVAPGSVQWPDPT